MLPLDRFLPVTHITVDRLQDRTVMVRRYAIQVSVCSDLGGEAEWWNGTPAKVKHVVFRANTWRSPSDRFAMLHCVLLGPDASLDF